MPMVRYWRAEEEIEENEMKNFTAVILIIGGVLVMFTSKLDGHALGGTILLCTGIILRFMPEEKTK